MTAVGGLPGPSSAPDGSGDVTSEMLMAAFVLFVLAVASGVVVADLVWENPATGQVTLFHHTVAGYPEGSLLAIAAGLGFVAALLLVGSVNSTKRRRAGRKQLRRLGEAWRTR